MEEDNDGGQHAAHLADVQNMPWAEFVMSGRPAALAEYLRVGGEIDDAVRQILIDILRNCSVKKTEGRKDRYRDYMTYFHVGQKTTPRFKVVGTSISTTSKGLSKTAACQLYAEETGQELRAVEKQYERGSKIFSHNFDAPKPPDPKNEK